MASGSRGPSRPEQDAPTADVRVRQSLNLGWRFIRRDVDVRAAVDATGWTAVDLPHTWNIEDVWDDEPGYYRGVGWYRRIVKVDAAMSGRRLFLHFEGVGQAADVFVNGEPAGSHEGGYTAFTIDVTGRMRPGHPEGDLIAVRADNAERTHLPPLSGDFNFYGGIYRDVWLVATGPVHIATDDHGSPGVFIDSPDVNEARATVRVRGTVVNETPRGREVRVTVSVTRLSDGARKPAPREEEVPAGTGTTPLVLDAGGRQAFEVRVPVLRPERWTTETAPGVPPPRYVVRVEVLEAGGAVLDRIDTLAGIRTLRFDPATGFWLNEQPLKLRGANRHQDRDHLGNALPDALHVWDLEAIKAMGANFVRLAHYPQDPSVLEAADRLGLLVWEEIPIVDRVTPTPAFEARAREMLTEMIRQHYNHPSIAIWGYMNEVLQKLPPAGEARARYVDWTLGLARRLDTLARTEDPSRATAMAVESRDDYEASGLGDVPQVLGFNLYHGWYYGTFHDFGPYLDRKRQRYPRTTLLVSEYGADGDTRLHSHAPTRYDYSAEYQRLLHEAYVPQIEARGYLAGTSVWVQNDFGAEHRGESFPHRNQKGLARNDRVPKDVSFFYQARWQRSPVVHIATSDAPVRVATVASRGQPATMPVTVYSNCNSVDLVHRGRALGVRRGDGTSTFRWDVPFFDGPNELVARAACAEGPREARAEVSVRVVAPGALGLLQRGEAWAVNCGSASQYRDADGVVWAADRALVGGPWGFETGTGVERTNAPNVRGTGDDPLLQSHRVAPGAYRFDVPDGQYDVEVRLVEVDRRVRPGERVFEIGTGDDGSSVRIDLSQEVGPWVESTRTLPAHAAAGHGLRVVFRPVVGDPVVSAIRITRR